jgi:hypothetical protein
VSTEAHSCNQSECAFGCRWNRERDADLAKEAIKRENEFWQQVFCAALEGGMSSGQLPTLNGRRLDLEDFAADIADAALVEAKKRGRL